MQITGNGWLLPALLVSWVGVAVSQTVKVSIDVKPGDVPTTIDPGREGMLPVAILSTAQFDASTVDPATVRLGSTGSEAEPVRTMSDDVNKDGRSDLMMLVRNQDLKVKCGDKIIRLTGKTTNGTSIEGSEAVTTSGC